jgi:hypothetical protein
MIQSLLLFRMALSERHTLIKGEALWSRSGMIEIPERASARIPCIGSTASSDRRTPPPYRPLPSWVVEYGIDEMLDRPAIGHDRGYGMRG